MRPTSPRMLLWGLYSIFHENHVYVAGVTSPSHLPVLLRVPDFAPRLVTKRAFGMHSISRLEGYAALLVALAAKLTHDIRFPRAIEKHSIAVGRLALDAAHVIERFDTDSTEAINGHQV